MAKYSWGDGMAEFFSWGDRNAAFYGKLNATDKNFVGRGSAVTRYSIMRMMWIGSVFHGETGVLWGSRYFMNDGSLVARYFRGIGNLWQVISREKFRGQIFHKDGCLVTIYFVGDGSFLDKYRFHGRWGLSGNMFEGKWKFYGQVFDRRRDFGGKVFMRAGSS